MSVNEATETVLGWVRWRHDRDQPTVEDKIIVCTEFKEIEQVAGFKTKIKEITCRTKSDGVVIPASKTTLHNCHSSMIWRVNSKEGGFVETYREGATTPDYVHRSEIPGNYPGKFAATYYG